jgi:hypothetical protein
MDKDPGSRIPMRGGVRTHDIHEPVYLEEPGEGAIHRVEDLQIVLCGERTCRPCSAER